MHTCNVVDMALEDNARNLYLDGTRLYGDTKEDGFWRTQSTIDLDSIFGNNDGDFQLGGSKFSGSAQNIRLEGSKLRAKLTKRDRKSGVEAILDLATVLRVINGMFVFISKCVYYFALHAMRLSFFFQLTIEKEKNTTCPLRTAGGNFKVNDYLHRCRKKLMTHTS